MADEVTDGELRRELQAHGVKNVGSITSTTRSIYIKKLNHLRAAERKKSKSPGRPQSSRKLIGFSSDESEGENSKEAQVRGRTSGRRRTTNKNKTKTESKPTGTRITGRSGLRRNTRLKAEPEASTASVSLQASMHNTTIDNDMSAEDDDPDGFASTDSDEDEENESSIHSPEMASKSLNTSSYLDDSPSFLSRTFSRQNPVEIHSHGRRSMGTGDGTRYYGKNIVGEPQETPKTTTSDRRVSRGRNSLARPSTKTDRSLPLPKAGSNNINRTGNHVPNHINPDDSYLSEEENIIQHGFKTKEDPNSYKCSQYISGVLVILTSLFFVGLAIMYMQMGEKTDLPARKYISCVVSYNVSSIYS